MPGQPRVAAAVAAAVIEAHAAAAAAAAGPCRTPHATRNAAAEVATHRTALGARPTQRGWRGGSAGPRADMTRTASRTARYGTVR